MNKKIIVFAIILCICAIAILSFIKIGYQSKIPESIDGRTEKNQLLLSGVGVFSERYTGEYKSKDIINKLEELTKQDIPDLYNKIKKFDDTKIEKYYKKNAYYIKNTFGKSNIGEFKKFAKKLQSLPVNLNDWYSLNIDKDSFEDVSDQKKYSYVEYTVSYNEVEVKFSIYIAHKNNQDPEFIIDIKQ